MKVPCTEELLKEKLDTIRGAVTMAYPMGLPHYDPIRKAIEDQNFGVQGSLDPSTATLYFGECVLNGLRLEQ